MSGYGGLGPFTYAKRFFIYFWVCDLWVVCNWGVGPAWFKTMMIPLLKITLQHLSSDPDPNPHFPNNNNIIRTKCNTPYKLFSGLVNYEGMAKINRNTAFLQRQHYNIFSPRTRPSAPIPSIIIYSEKNVISPYELFSGCLVWRPGGAINKLYDKKHFFIL